MTPKKVLVVDEEPSVRKLMATTIAAQGLEVVDAPSAEEALEVPGPFLVIIIDLSLPKRTAVVEAHPEAKIITVSGRPEADLQKPFPMSALLDRVKAVLP